MRASGLISAHAKDKKENIIMKKSESNINSASTDFKRTIVPFQEQTIRNNFIFHIYLLS